MAVFTEEQRANLIAAIAKGVLTVRSGDEMVTYQSIDDMLKVLAMMEAELDPASRPRRTLAKYSSGLR